MSDLITSFYIAPVNIGGTPESFEEFKQKVEFTKAEFGDVFNGFTNEQMYEHYRDACAKLNCSDVIISTFATRLGHEHEDLEKIDEPNAILYQDFQNGNFKAPESEDEQ